MTEAPEKESRRTASADEESGARAPLELIADRLLDTRLGRVWERYAPLSVGAVGSAVVVVAGAQGLRHLFRAGRRRKLAWIGALALVPVALMLFPKRLEAPEGEDGAEAPGVD